MWNNGIIYRVSLLILLSYIVSVKQNSETKSTPKLKFQYYSHFLKIKIIIIKNKKIKKISMLTIKY